MTATTLEGHNRTSITIDVCASCQAFWFDTHENLRLAPAGTLRLFKLIGESSPGSKAAWANVLRCPHCRSRLIATHDRQRNTAFQYWSCDQGHGRFVSFFDFLREKNFIQPLSPQQIDELRQNVQTVNCSNCGAAIDLARSSACEHCGSPLSMLDMKQAAAIVSELQRASQPRPIDPALPLNLARAQREVEASFAAMGADADWWKEAPSSGLVGAGLNAVIRWLKQS
jgi:DNA-directed RNA polymerase subunit RPC12/RpoP